MGDFQFRQVYTRTGIQDSMLVMDMGEVDREKDSYLRVLAHPDLAYYESRRLRDDTHPVFRWMAGVPLDVIDTTLRGIVVEVEDPIVKRAARVLSKQVDKLGERGALELVARVGALLGWIEKGDQ